jgi:hypothetical protein
MLCKLLCKSATPLPHRICLSHTEFVFFNTPAVMLQYNQTRNPRMSHKRTRCIAPYPTRNAEPPTSQSRKATSMTRRRLVTIGLPAVLFVCLAVFFFLPRHRINADGFECIERGMTEGEVEAILGGPAGDYTRGRYHSRRVWAGAHRDWYYKTWTGKGVEITIAFNRRDGTVGLKYIYPDERTKGTSFLDLLHDLW